MSLGLERNAALLFWGMVLVQSGFGASDAFRTLFMESLGASPAVIGLLLAGFEATRLTMLVVTGSLSHRMSTRTMLRMRWGSAISGVLWLGATSWWMLAPGLVAQAASSIAWPAVSRVVDESGPPEDRQRRFLLVFTVAPGIALLGSPLLGAWIVERWGLRAVWVALVVFCSAGTVFYTLVRPCGDGGARAAGGYREVLRHRPSRAICLLTLFTTYATYLGMALAPNYLHNERGLSYGFIGTLSALVAVGSIGAALTLGRVRRLARTLEGTLVVGAFLPPTFALLLFGGTPALAAAAFVTFGVGSVVQQTFRPAMSDVTPPSDRIRGFALIEATIAAGVMCASVSAGALYAVSPRLPLAASAVATTRAVVATVVVRRDIHAWQGAGSPMPARPLH